MEWTPECVLRLLDEYQKYPVLYHRRAHGFQGLRRLSAKTQDAEGLCNKIEKLQKKLREKTPIGKLDELQEGKHPFQEKEPLKLFPDNTNPETGEVGGPKGPEPTRYGDWERKGRVSDF
ncbi:succinate dehydrogenase assembly factor 4, mitochondrial-like [Bacillus rossius redtenbacheri]|uniref:succinate dehydrogenase assembly factor 4, mitochondrial-like n=1 Tax=Bacillus rossius redtenbacheri TaxID=93214 RepID=UPI002FDDDF6F